MEKDSLQKLYEFDVIESVSCGSVKLFCHLFMLCVLYYGDLCVLGED